jgi:hypothetical protein
MASGEVTAEADGRSRELFPVAIGPNEGLALRECVRRERAVRTLECGLGFAISTLVEDLEPPRSPRMLSTDERSRSCDAERRPKHRPFGSEPSR